MSNKRNDAKVSSKGIGRGRPPKERQFRKGQSGNPKGRPKGSKNLATLVRQAAYDKITVTSKNGEHQKLSRIQATILQLATKGASGDPKSMLAFINMVNAMELRIESYQTDIPLNEADLKVLHAVHARMQLCSTNENDNVATPT